MQKALTVKNRNLLIVAGISVLAVIFVGIFLKSFSLEGGQVFQNKISAVILPHHDLAKSERQALLDQVAAKTQPKTIILVSPNHFDSGTSNIITTSKTWKLANAQILPAKSDIENLVSSGLVIDDENAFLNEHGITNVLEDLNNSFPDAKVLPIIIKPSASKENLASFFAELTKINFQDCLLVSSVDFSHYQPGALAEIHDSLSIRALADLDEDLIWQAEVDSPQALALAISWAKHAETGHFNLSLETNSGKLQNSPNAESTSYVLGYFEKNGESAAPKEMTFQIGGDMMFDRLVSAKYPKNNLVNVVSKLGERFFWGVDAALVNLEGPIGETYSLPNTAVDNLSFRFPPKTVEVLSFLHLNAVTLANNHTLNGASSMLENTKSVLTKAGITPMGDQTHVGEETFSYQDQKLTIITINTLEDSSNINSKIKAAKNDGAFVLIFPHWGSEYSQTHSQSQARLAHDWIDAGADLVIGSHPHVVSDAELYKGKPIFYSLGNLLFDQTFSKETQRGLVIAGKISKDELTLVLLPTISVKLQPQLLGGDERYQIISKLRTELNQAPLENSYGFDTIRLSR